jgi:hypothetical protein
MGLDSCSTIESSFASHLSCTAHVFAQWAPWSSSPCRPHDWLLQTHTLLDAASRRKLEPSWANLSDSLCPLLPAPPLDLVRPEHIRQRGLQFYDGKQQRLPPSKSIAFLGTVPALIINAVQPR